MKVDLNKIDELLHNSNLSEVAKAVGIPYRTLQAWKRGENKWWADTQDKLTKLQNYANMEELKMEKQADKIVDAIKCGMHLYGTTEGLTIKEVAKRNEVEENQVIEFLGYEGEGFVVDENYNITGSQEYGYEVINGDMIYIIAPDAEELTADQITSVTTGFGGQGYNIDFSVKGLNADLYVDTDYYEWYDGEEVDEEFVKVNFSKIMEDIEDKEVKWSIEK